MISVVLAVHNEAHNLPRCLAAVQKFADEIIVVDGESSDDTVNVAKKYGAQVISTTNKKNFHINKQMAMDKANGDLVLQLDADEVVDDELAAFITKIQEKLQGDNAAKPHIKNSDTLMLWSSEALPAAWWIRRKNFFLGKFLTKGGQYPDPVIRLYVNGKAKLPQKDVHEQMVVDGTVGWAQGHLLHYGNPSFSEYLRKWNTYTSFKADQLAEQQVTISPLHSFHYLLWLPLKTWAMLFFRHKGFMDGMAGFVFALYSGLYHSVSYLKLWEIYQTRIYQKLKIKEKK